MTAARKRAAAAKRRADPEYEAQLQRKRQEASAKATAARKLAAVARRNDPEFIAQQRERWRKAAAKRYASGTADRRSARLAAASEQERERAEERAAARKSAAERAAKEAAAEASLAAEATAVEGRIRESGMMTGKHPRGPEGVLRDACYDTMHQRAALREPRVSSPIPDARHPLKLRHGGRYIGIAEFACRVAERDACHRAAEARDKLKGACEVIALLERDTEGPARIHDMVSFRATRKAPSGALEVHLRAPVVEEVDPFDDAFGDWAPAWMQPARIAA